MSTSLNAQHQERAERCARITIAVRWTAFGNSGEQEEEYVPVAYDDVSVLEFPHYCIPLVRYGGRSGFGLAPLHLLAEALAAIRAQNVSADIVTDVAPGSIMKRLRHKMVVNVRPYG